MKIKLLIALIIMSLFTFGLGITYMYFNTGDDAFFDQKIASFIFNVEKKDKLEIPLNDLKPGDKKEFDFQVTNSNDKKISNVSIDYKIILKTYHFAPLKIELYSIDNNKNNLILDCNETFSRNSENQIVCNTEMKQLSHSKKTLHDYKLVVSFPATYNGEEYSNLVDFIDLEIMSNQRV